MKMALECLPCLVRQAVESTKLALLDADQWEGVIRQLLAGLATDDWNATPVGLSQMMQKRVRQLTQQADPYAVVKHNMNAMALELLPDFERLMQEQPDPQEALVRLVLAGNLLDSGAKVRLSPEELPQLLQGVWRMPFSGDACALFEAVARAQSILYLADNAGEIIFDRLLIEALPRERVTVAVRGHPILNDATLADARLAGIDQLVRVIDNGSDAPGTLLEQCSPEFVKAFEQADLIISKGQGNFETLFQAATTSVDDNSGQHARQIFFLLTAKCRAIAQMLDTQEGTLVVKSQMLKD